MTSTAQSSSVWPGRRRANAAGEADEQCHGDQRRAPATAEPAIADEAAERFADGARGLTDSQEAGGGHCRVHPAHLEVKHEVRKRGELDHAEKRRRQTKQKDVARTQHRKEAGTHGGPVGALVAGHARQALLDLADGGDATTGARADAAICILVEHRGEAADSEGHRCGHDEARLPARRQRRRRHDGCARHPADVDRRLVETDRRAALPRREPPHHRLDG